MQGERRRTSGWVHVVPSVLLTLSICCVPSGIAVTTFRIADASVELRPAAPFGAAADALLAAISCTLLSSFVIMLTYWLVLRGREQTTRTLQTVGLVTTGVLAVIGLLTAALLVSNYVSYSRY